MKIGILQADSVAEQFRTAHGDYPEMFEAILTRAAESMGDAVTCETFNVVNQEYPREIGDCHGYVITGSKQSVYDGDEWITRLSDYIRVLHASRKPLVGICFGHQLIAEALGGKTQAAEVGWGVGVHSYDIITDHWSMAPALEDYSVLVSHKDQVTELPAGAALLAQSDFCPNAMFAIDDHILALQGHPEFQKGYSEDLMNWRREILGEELYQAGIQSLGSDLQSPELALWILRFLKGPESV